MKVWEISYHRNGIGGAPFHVVLFNDPEASENLMVAIVFEEPNYVAVLDTKKTANGDIEFAQGNSWRGDYYEAELRKHIKDQYEAKLRKLKDKS